MQYFKELVSKANKSLNKEEVINIRKKILKISIPITIIGAILVFGGFIGFAVFSFLNVQSFGEHIVPLLICFICFNLKKKYKRKREPPPDGTRSTKAKEKPHQGRTLARL